MSPALTVLEFVCNLRWLLLYATKRLDPVIESHYASVMHFALMAEGALSRSFAAVRSVREVPAAAIRVAQNGALYLLVAEAVLGHCPPTMHSFLLRATSDSVDCGENSVVSSVFQSTPAVSEPQTHFLLLRWLIAEGLLTDEELLDSLGDSQVPRTASGRFELHITMAKELASSEPFALSAHVILMRALLLHHCSTVVSAEDIIAHVRFLNPACAAKLRGMEDTLLFWMQNVIERQKQGNGTAAVHLKYAARAALRGSLYRALQCGVVPALLVHYYQPQVLSPDGITTGDKGHGNWATVLRAAEELGLSLGIYADEVSQAGAVVLQLHVLRIAEELFAVLATQAEDAEEATEKERAASSSLLPIPPFTQSEKDTSPSLNHSKANDETIVEAGGTVSSVQEYPSAHSIRQYDLMTASIHMRRAKPDETPLSFSGAVKSRDQPSSASVYSNAIHSIPFFPLGSERSSNARAPTPAILVASHRSLPLLSKPSERQNSTGRQESVEGWRMQSLGGTCTTSESSFPVHVANREDDVRLPLSHLCLSDVTDDDVVCGGGTAPDEDSTALSPLTPIETSAFNAPAARLSSRERETFGDRDALQQRLQREQGRGYPFVQYMTANKKVEDCGWLSELSDWGSVRTPQRLLSSEVDLQTDDSGQLAETNVSSVLDDHLDSAGSFFAT